MINKTKALLLGIAIPTGIPLLIITVFGISAAFPEFRYAVLVGCTVGVFYYTALSIIYVVHIVRNAHLTRSNKISWLMILFFSQIFAMPVYWRNQIWHKATFQR